MDSFSVKLQTMKQESSDIKEYMDQMKRYQQELEDIRIALRWKISCREEISNRIKAAESRVEEQARQLGMMESSLVTIIRLYESSERKILGQDVENAWNESSIDSSSMESIRSYFSNVDWKYLDHGKLVKDLVVILGGRAELFIIDKVIEFFRGEYVKKIIETANWINTIEDEQTKEYLNKYSNYAQDIKDAYDNATGPAKEVYDKYKDKIIIASMDADGSYQQGRKLYIDYEEDIKDPRGADSIYYHETGHWIVNENKWVSYEDGQPAMSPEFQKFDEAVKQDVSNYIAEIESQQRALYEGKYSGKQLDAMVKKGTREYLETVLGGDNFHTLDGVSDMINAASNGKYWISYGHGTGYWDANPTRQANEAFAEMFSADFCNDTTESDFMREHFPNAYREYENLRDGLLD